ncbi:hypothetical protein Q1695_003673 [Nippostrongylus brasiliensis]|nr:hypothetical protein Q1695_003673 [Nippostrongylus brasiliensis]
MVVGDNPDDRPLSFDGFAVIGVVYLVVPTVLLLFYISFNLVLATDYEFGKMQVHRLMLYIGMLDCIQLFCHAFAGVATLWMGITVSLPFLCKFIGATLNSAWVALFPLSVLIAIHRLFLFHTSIRPNSDFPWPVKVGLAICFVYWFGFWTILATLAEVTYHPESVSWSYGTDRWSVFMENLEFIVCNVSIAVTFSVYVVIAVLAYKMRTGRSKSLQRSELRLLLHATLMFTILTSLLFAWHYYFILPSSNWTFFAINMYWILYCCLNPFLYMIFSRLVAFRVSLETKKNSPFTRLYPAIVVSYRNRE